MTIRLQTDIKIFSFLENFCFVIFFIVWALIVKRLYCYVHNTLVAEQCIMLFKKDNYQRITPDQNIQVHSNLIVHPSHFISCVKFVCTNIFGHSLVSVLECKPRRIFEYIQIFVQFSIWILIRTFVRVKQINMNIFGYSFV